MEFIRALNVNNVKEKTFEMIDIDVRYAKIMIYVEIVMN
jgi:hypothetical protein